MTTSSEQTGGEGEGDGAPVAAVVPDATPLNSDPSSATADDTAVLRVSRLVEGGRARSAGEPSGAEPTGGRAAAYAALASARLHAVPLPVAAAAGLALALGLGYGLGGVGRPDNISALRWSEAADGLRQSHTEIGKLAAELKAVKAGLEGLKSERERSRSDLSARHAQLLDKVERAGQENAARIGRVAEQLDRVEKTQRDPARLGAVTERLERIEKSVASASPPAASMVSPTPVSAATGGEKVASAPTPPPKPAGSAATEPTQTGSLGEKKAEPDPRRTPLDGFVLRDVEDGYALIETRSGRFVEVAAGETLPGVGRVEAIERRGRQWVVVTPKGFIGQR